MKVNLFDFDNTIYQGDSSTDFYFYSLMKKPIIIKTIPKIILYGIKYKLGIIDMTRLKEINFSFLKYIDVDEMVKCFWESHRKNIKDFYLKRDHTSDIIISASPEFLLKPICEDLGVKDMIGSIVDKKTGNFKLPNCHDVEKVKRLNQKYHSIKVMEAYSDSLSDKPILELAEKSYLVKNNKIIPTDF